MAGKLTDARIRALKATGKVQKISDGGGLYIHVTEKSSRLWRLAYQFEGKQKLLALGGYPALSLAEARKQRDSAKGLLAKGIDPAVEKKRAKYEVQRETDLVARTFRAVALEWVEVQKDSWAASNLKKKMRLLEMLFYVMGDKPIAHIIPADILAILRPIEACGKNVTAHALAQTANQVCRYARVCGYCVFNAADGLTKVLKPIESKHYACLTSPADVGRLLRFIDDYQGSLSMMYALRILPYVVLRSTELRGAAWTEIDLDNALWIVPASRSERPRDGGGMKMRIAHEVPLARQVVELFRQLRIYQQKGPLCFPGTHSATRCISDVGLLNAIRRMGYGKSEMTIHGFRGTFSTLLNEKKLEWGIDADVIEKQLAHKEKDAIRGAYNHAAYLEQRRRLMQLWVDYLDGLRSGACSSDRKEI